MKKEYSYLGEVLDDIEPELISEAYGHKGLNGQSIPNWTKENEYVDGYGFDKTNTEPEGGYIQVVELPRGTRLCRYGIETGKMTTLVGTPYENLSLPFKKEMMEYHEYDVIADGVFVKCVVTRGRTAKMFDSDGGAIQFLHSRRIVDEITTGRLKETREWLKRRKICARKP